jgi:membrane protein YqaA with SNARE-associated domain
MQQTVGKLQPFVEASKSKGASDEFLATFLIRRGWPPNDVYAALGNYWEQVTGIAVPERAIAGESSRDAFFYLLSFATLATWSSALGSTFFHLIEYWLPDPVARGYVYNVRDAITWQMASIAVAFPIFLLVMRTIVRDTATHPERLQSGVRKWLTYIALLLTAGAVIGDLIWFLDYFLTGERVCASS